jgi:hypothetical protein
MPKMNKRRFLVWCNEERARMGQARAEGALENLEAMDKSGLVEVAKAAKVKGYSRMNMDQLREAITVKVRDEATPATLEEFAQDVSDRKVQLPQGWTPRKALRALKVEVQLVNRANDVARDENGQLYATSRSFKLIPKKEKAA